MTLSRLLLNISAPAVVLGSALVSAAGALIIAWAGTPALAVFGVVLTGLALGGIFPTVVGIASARFPEHSGTVFGILFTIALSGGMLMPWISGHLAEAAGLPWVFVLAAVNFVAIAGMSVAMRRRQARLR